MAQVRPSLAKGTRDFSPIEMDRRNFIFETIRSVFRKYGYQEIQTPSFENLSTLTGKYGDEGDKLIFKILNSGDFMSKVDSNAYNRLSSQDLTPIIAEKALRYDLTVPFARYVVMHQHEIAFPFKRFQIQPVWRADRPQKGRYREFYQCDVDVVGSKSLLNEAEFVQIYDEALKKLGLRDFTIKLNNRKLLAALADSIGKPQLLGEMTMAIDKLDKIGFEGVVNELIERGFQSEDMQTLRPILQLKGSNEEKLIELRKVLKDSEIGLLGIQEIETVIDLTKALNEDAVKNLEIDITLARGLNYYTGSIFEVKTNEVQMGSIGGGGRYDNLTGIFGLQGLTGVGISFGADRIYDVLSELNLFPTNSIQSTRLLIANFGLSTQPLALSILQHLRKAGIPAEFYPEVSKLKKQLTYADGKKIPFVLLLGEEELHTGILTLKNMTSGEQRKLREEELLEYLKH